MQIPGWRPDQHKIPVAPMGATPLGHTTHKNDAGAEKGLEAAAEKRAQRPTLVQGEDPAQELYQEQARKDMEAARAAEPQYQAVNPDT